MEIPENLFDREVQGHSREFHKPGHEDGIHPPLLS